MVMTCFKCSHHTLARVKLVLSTDDIEVLDGFDRVICSRCKTINAIGFVGYLVSKEPDS